MKKLIIMLLMVSGVAVWKVSAESTPEVTPLPVPTTATVSVPPGTPSGPAVAVASSAAPPTWAQDLLVTVEKLPVVGPIVAKGLVWLGIIGAILTTLCAAMLAVTKSLQGVSNAAKLTEFSTALSNFENGPIMYWIKYFSMFNAKKVEPPVQTIASK